MPIFDFKCKWCNEVTEKIVPFHTESIECPKCLVGEAVKAEVSNIGGFSFKNPAGTLKGES